ncbi:hypothetical protein OE88DRAFT_1722041 [Heliocybe sulcata]|uniref:Pal1-domain-containing protein n=1 Tax=Heliocybe sulcata TaxID=5364 RepID=A0A5C3NGH1_9AGAM|nr:hypothetical protein OE88DRAFT_1722041 [Heliocybe sulcata]
MADTVREHSGRPVDRSPRTRMGRSQTAVPPAREARPPPPPGRRSHSQDSVIRAAAAADNSKASAGRTRTGKKGSAHADVIDRLDFSGVGQMFHHDGPFDACAPSRNRHRTKAPMLAWSQTPPADQQALDNAYSPGGYESPYSAAATPYTPYESPYDPPKKKVDALAEAWGMHEPEPFEEFFAGGGNSRYDESAPNSIYNGRERHSTEASRGRRAGTRQEAHAVNPRRPLNTQKRSVLPPPQPIFVPDAAEGVAAEPPSPQSATGHGTNVPKRSRSLMQRIKKMRETPNVPVGYQDVPSADGSPTSSGENTSAPYGATAQRPTHRSQNSFLGRFGGKATTKENTNPYGHTKEISPMSENSDNFVYVDMPEVPARGSTSSNRDKSLPAAPLADRTPSGSGSGDYFDSRVGDGMSPGGSLGRKTSLLKKMRGVVRK